jgi:hypothetical protein
VDLDPARLPLHSDERVTFSKFIFVLLLPFFTLSWRFWWGNGFKGPKLIPFWCLMPKGEKIRPKQEMDQLPIENFWKSRVRVFVCQNTLVCLLLSKVGLLWGEGLIMGKRGSFWILDQFLMKYLSLCFNMCVWLRDRKLSLICKNKPSGGKRVIQICKNLNQNNLEFLFELILHLFYWLYVVLA